MIAIHSLYITSSVLSTYNNGGPRGERNIKKNVSSAQFGDLILQDTWLDSDYTDVSNRPLKLIDLN